MNADHEILRRALRRMPEPQPRPGFVDAALARATAGERAARPRNWLVDLVTHWHTWAGAALGGAVAATVAVLMLRPMEPAAPQPAAIALVLHETRDIDVLIDSERALPGATIRIATIGSIALHGFEGEPEIGWQADLDRGNNLLSLPVVARSAGPGQLIATIEHEGRTRRMAIDVNVRGREGSQS